MNLHAVTEPVAITAALQTPEVRAVARLMASAGIERPTAKFNLFDLDRKLDASRLTTNERIQCKLALERAGLIARSFYRLLGSPFGSHIPSESSAAGEPNVSGSAGMVC
jgi:hypothetical protein